MTQALSCNKPEKNFLKRSDGFTLMEILVVMSLLVMVMGIGLVCSLDFYRGNIFWNEARTILSLLEQARNQAQNNINDSAHGFYVGPSGYTLFEGPSYAARNVEADENFPNGSGLKVSGMTETVFDQFSGMAKVSGGSLVIKDGVRQEVISINPQGMINW